MKLLITIGLLICLVGCGGQKQKCNTLPEGYEIVTDGQVYRFKFNETVSIFDRKTKEEAIEDACSFGAFIRKDKNTVWAPAN